MAIEPKIFISHRLADKPIADVIRNNLRRWGFNDVYQAGAPGAGPRVGESLPDELRDALDQASLVILVYTFTDEDWSWCMWECGLATHPRETDATRVIVFRCSKYDTPRLFAQQVMVDVEPEGVRNFTRQLHRNEDFFKGLGKAYRPALSDEDLEYLSSALYNELKPVIPPGKREERYRWDRFTLKLEPPVDRLNFETNENVMCEQIQSELIVTRPFGNALLHFGYANLEGGLKLGDLVERWTDQTQDRENVSKDWIIALCLEIRRAIDAYPAEPSWQPLNSVSFSRTSYFPVLNHMRVLPDSSMEFDIYFYAVKPNQ
jgi:TIR domain